MIDREGSNRWRAVVRRKDGTLVHASPWAPKKTAEHAAKNHRAMNRDIGLGYTVDVEEYGTDSATKTKRGHLSKSDAGNALAISVRRLAALRANGDDKRRTVAWREALAERAEIERQIRFARSSARSGRSHMSKRENAASVVADELGYEPDEATIERAQSLYGEYSTSDLRGQLDALERRFERAGGRGVDLANRIDALRIVLALRRSSRSHMSKRTGKLRLENASDRSLVKHHPSATHVQWFPSGARIEFKPSKHGGWASLAYNSDGRSFGSWIYFGSERPKAAQEIRHSGRSHMAKMSHMSKRARGHMEKTVNQFWDFVEEELVKSVANEPAKYALKPDEPPEVFARRIRDVFQRDAEEKGLGHTNLGTPTWKRVAKRLGIAKFSQKALKEVYAAYGGKA